jgi:hypothetical protein
MPVTLNTEGTGTEILRFAQNDSKVGWGNGREAGASYMFQNHTIA